MFLENRQIEIIKNSTKDYVFFLHQFRINKFNSFEDIENWLNRFKGIEITSIDNDYLDFIYSTDKYEINLSISSVKDGFSFSSTYEIYDRDIKEFIVEDYLSESEWLELIDTPRDEMLENAIQNLKFYESKNYTDSYNRLVNRLLVFLKENW